MSTRFSQWRNTEYVGLPVESYLQAGLVKDQRIDTELQKTSAALAEYKSLQALGANAEAYQNEIMSGIKTQLEDLAKGNLKSPEALMKMQSIVTNPTYIQGLKQVAKNTEYFKAAQKAAQDYEKESGNKINAAPFYKAYQELMNETGDASKFNANRFMGLDSVPKYIEVQKEMDDIISKMKPGTRVWDYKKGVYEYVKKETELTPDRILNAVKYEFGARKDLQLQLQRNIDYDSYSTGSSTEVRGQELVDAYGKAYDNTAREIDTYKTNPTAFKKKYGIKNDAELNGAVTALQNQLNEYDNLRKLDPRSALTQKAITQSAIASSSVFAYKEEDLKKTVNPMDVIAAQAAARQKQIDELSKLAKGNTAILDMGITFGQDAEALENKIKTNEYITELAGAAGLNGSKYVVSLRTEDQNPKSKSAMAATGVITLPKLTNEQYKNNRESIINEVAQKYGYKKGVSAEPTPEAFLQNVYRKNNHMGKGVYNSNFDSEAITQGISAANSAVYVNGIMVTTDEKNQYLNMLNNPTNESKGISLAKSAKPIISVRMDGVVVANYRNPAKPNEVISYEVPQSLAYGFDKLKELTVAKSNPTYGLGYTKPIDVEVPGVMTTRGEIPGGRTQFTAARVGDGTNNLVMFKDAANPKLIGLGVSLIDKVAREMADYDFNKYADADKLKLYNKAIEVINNNYSSNITKGPDGRNSIANSPEGRTIMITKSDGTKKFVDLGNNVFIINRGLKSLNDLTDLRVGMGDPNYKVQTGKGFVNLGGSFGEDPVFNELHQKGGELLTDPDKYKVEKAAIINSNEYLPIPGME